MTKYQAYPEYKDSGVEWLGEIPTDWNVTALKNISKIINGSTPKSGVESYWDGQINWMTPTDLSQKSGCHVSDSLRKITLSGLESCGTTLVPANTIILSTRAPIGSIAIGTSEFCTNQGCKSIVISDVSLSKFIYYLLSILTGPLNNLGRGSTFLEISSDDLGSVRVSVPRENIKNILDFLDYETTKIDNLIEKQQQLIELLKEKRQAVISHAVTKGLNPDVPMKDTGVEWLGEVPEHWEITNLNYVLDAIGDVDHYMPQSVDECIPYVMTGDLTEFASNIKFEECKQVSLQDYAKLSKRIKTCKGDVILARYATIGTVSYVDLDKDFLVSYSCVTIKTNTTKLLGLYLYYYFKSYCFLQGIQCQVNTNTQGNVGVQDLKGMKIVLPCINEQMSIIISLHKTLSDLDKLSNKAAQAICLMQERRTALISAAVTGKIDVRNWVAPAASEAAADTESQEVNA